MQPPDTCVCVVVSSVVFCHLYVRNSNIIHKCYCTVLYFYKIIKYVAIVKMLILKRETRKHSKTVFYYTHVQNAIN